MLYILMEKNLFKGVIMKYFLAFVILISTLIAKDANSLNCKKLGENFLKVQGECVEYKSFEGEEREIN